MVSRTPRVEDHWLPGDLGLHGLMIIRVVHRRQFTVVANQALRDPRLSFRATGLLAYLLSLAPDTEISGHRIQQTKKEGRDAVYAALKELEIAGYLQRQRFKDRLGKWYWANVLAELPPENPQPLPGFPYTGNQGLETRIQESKDEEQKTDGRDASLRNENPNPLALPDVPVAKGLPALIRKQLEERTG